MPKVRAYGADATLLACRETTYGVAPLSGYRSLDFKSADLSAEQPLGDDPLLGRGRNAQDPYRGLITDEGKVDIPLGLLADRIVRRSDSDADQGFGAYPLLGSAGCQQHHWSSASTPCTVPSRCNRRSP